MFKMARMLCSRTVLLAALGAVVTWSTSALAQESTPKSEDTPTSGAPADSALQREYARLAQLLNSDDTLGRNEAVDSLLKVRPTDVANADTRKLIARGYRSVATSAIGSNRDKAVRGLVIWGGKYSGPILIELLEKDTHGQSDELYDAIARLREPQGADALAKHLGNFFSHDKAYNALRKMGSSAEGALIKTAPSDNADVSLACIQLLGEVGGPKSIDVLQRASEARNQQVKLAARDSLKKIRVRQKNGESVDKPAAAVDPNSPFAEGSGPPVDITARNTRAAAKRSNIPAGFGTPKDAGAATSDDSTEAPADVSEGDWTEVLAILPGDPTGAGVPADPDTTPAADGFKPQPVRLANKNDFHERPAAISVVGGKSPTAVVIHTNAFQKNIARLEPVNLRRRQAFGSSNVIGGVTGCFLSPSGERVLLVADDPIQNRQARLDVWAMNGGKPTEQATWWPFATSKSPWANDIMWADWINDEQLLTANAEGTTVLWKIDGKTPKAIYQIDASRYCIPALSPGRTHLALSTASGVEIFRATDGELLARMNDVRPNGGSLAFNADGTKLACVYEKSVYIWDSTTGKLERDFDCAELRSGSLAWLDKTHLLVRGVDIVDIERRNILWRYEAPNLPSDMVGATRWMLMENNNALGIVPAKLLQDEVLAAARHLDPEKILALKPGAKVTLDIQLGGEDQAKAEAALKAALEQNGVQVAPDQPIKLSARMVTGKSETKEYTKGPFFSGEREQVTVTEQLYEVELTIDGQSAWKHSSSMQSGFGPPVIWTKKGESAQQTLDRENSERSAHFGFSASIPRYVVHPKYAGPLGTSKISFAGTK